ARCLGANPLGWHDHNRLESHRRVETVDAATVADHEPTSQRGRDVVRMTLDLHPQPQDVGAELEHVVGGHLPCHHSPGARTGAAQGLTRVTAVGFPRWTLITFRTAPRWRAPRRCSRQLPAARVPSEDPAAGGRTARRPWCTLYRHRSPATPPSRPPMPARRTL